MIFYNKRGPQLKEFSRQIENFISDAKGRRINVGGDAGDYHTNDSGLPDYGSGPCVDYDTIDLSIEYDVDQSKIIEAINKVKSDVLTNNHSLPNESEEMNITISAGIANYLDHERNKKKRLQRMQKKRLKRQLKQAAI